MSLIGVIFDWDGVVVDSSRLHLLSWQKLAEENGRSLPEELPIGSLGIKTEAVLGDLLRWAADPAEAQKLALRKEALFRKLASEVGIRPQPGVLGFLQGLKQAGVPCAVGSSAPRLNVQTGLDLLDAQGLFAVIVSADDVPCGKPAPDIFLKAAEQLGRRPDECVVFEDAPAGVDAARAAGMRVVGVLSTHDPHALHRSDLLIENFLTLSVAEFENWVAVGRTERPLSSAR
jgi:beta-phosphoglucomutase family hydrolase